jgi:hypothetical protein
LKEPLRPKSKNNFSKKCLGKTQISKKIITKTTKSWIKFI